MKGRFIYALMVGLLGGTASGAQDRWSFELQFGVVHSIDLPLTFYQDGYPEIRIDKADYYCEPLNDPPYWDWRFSRWKNNKSIELEAVHHKFYLRNLVPGVDRFGISHGFNMVFINRGWQWGPYIFRAGIGSALVHPESSIRGMAYPLGPGFDFPGYRVRGVNINLTGSRQFRISKTFFVNAEAKVHAAVANVPIINGHARVNILALQLILGPGVNWRVKGEV